MSADSYSSPVPTAPEPELDPQGRLVADAFVATAQAYFTLSEQLLELAAAGEASDEELEEVRAQASSLTARAAQVGREAKKGLFEHEGHGCEYEEAYAGVADFLGVLLESGAGLLEVHSLDQVDGEALAHPFGHFVPLLASDVGAWLHAHAGEEERALLEGFSDKVAQTMLEHATATVSLRFGPLEDADFEALRDWSQQGGPDEELEAPLAEALRAALLEIRDEIESHDHPHLFRLGQSDESVVLLDGDFHPGVFEPLLDALEDGDVPFRLEDWETLDECCLVTLSSPDLPYRVTRRALDAEEGLLFYQLDVVELEGLLAVGAEMEDVEAYLDEDMIPGQRSPSEALARLATLLYEADQ